MKVIIIQNLVIVKMRKFINLKKDNLLDKLKILKSALFNELIFNKIY